MRCVTTTTDPRPRPLAAAARSTHGVALTFETVGALEDGRALLRVRPLEDTLLRVIAGVLRLGVDGEERLLAAGDEAIVPAGAAHRLSGAGGEARFVSGLRRR